MSWIEQDTECVYAADGGAVQAIVTPSEKKVWHWKVGVLQNGRTEWSLGGDVATREQAIDSAKAMISLMEFALESGGVAPCGW